MPLTRKSMDFYQSYTLGSDIEHIAHGSLRRAGDTTQKRTKCTVRDSEMAVPSTVRKGRKHTLCSVSANSQTEGKNIFWVQGWRSGESTRLPPMWPRFNFQTRRHMWVEFVGSLLCTEMFSSGTPVSPLLKNLWGAKSAKIIVILLLGITLLLLCMTFYY